LQSNIATQIYSHKSGFNVPYHLTRANDEQVGHLLSNFMNDYGAPEHLTFDGAAVQVGSITLVQDNLRRAEIRHHVSAPRRPKENLAEAAIQDIKKQWYQIMLKKQVPKRLWDYGISWVCETGNFTTNSSRYSDNRTPLEIITGETPDISEYLEFGIYGWVLFKTNAGVTPPELGRWLGVSHRVGRIMSYWILPPSGIPISCNTVQRLTNLEQQTNDWKRRMTTFDDELEAEFRSSSSDICNSTGDILQDLLLDLDGEGQEFIQEFNRVIDNSEIPHHDDTKDDGEVGIQDPYLNMELGLQHGDEEDLRLARVKQRAVDVEGRPVGRPSDNPLLDSRQYEVEFLDGETEILTANIIAENLLAQVDEEGCTMLFYRLVAIEGTSLSLQDVVDDKV
jgi:hypothetical protein